MIRTRRIRVLAAVGIAAAGITTFAATPQALAAKTASTKQLPAALIRVDQVGYLPSDAKHAYLMTTQPVQHATWDAVDSVSHVVAHGGVDTHARGTWNAN